MSENMIEVMAETTPEKPIEKEVVTRADLKANGWSAKEMDSAEKHGMIPKKEKVEKADAATKPEIKETKTETEEVKTPVERRVNGSWIDYEMTPEQEKVFLETFPQGTPQNGTHLRMKSERRARQAAEAERDRLALEVQIMKDSLKPQVEPVTEVDENGNVIDPEDRPLTMKQLKALQKQEMEAMNKQREELNQRSEKVSDALKLQEEYAKSSIADFEDTVKLATDLVNNLDQIPENWKKEKVKKLIRDLQITAGTADKYSVDDYTASMIAYELGQLHPKYGQKSDENGKAADPKGNGSLTPEQMKRLEENTQRRASSASLPGSSGGRRTISVSEITIKDVLKMNSSERQKFKKDHPEKMRQLLRG